MATLLSTTQANPPGRISQLLPNVKCSNCNRPVPLSELGDHVCATPPPVPTLPRPSVTPTAAASLLPSHLQDRLASPGPTSPRTTFNDMRLGSSPPSRLQEPQPQRFGSERLRISTASSSSSTYQPRSSPLARTAPDRNNAASPAARPRFAPTSPTSISTSPLRARPPAPSDIRPRTASNAGSMSSGFSGPSSPTTARPSFSVPRDPNPTFNNMRQPPSRDPMPTSPRDTLPPPPSRDPIPHRNMLASPVPQISERDIDTKSGGEAGMAGVGRRGFAAAARAAMFVVPTDRPLGPQTRRDDAPYLNTNVPTRTNDITPPLSAGSGYSSHSPGVSPYPQSPVAPHRLPSPERYDPKAQSQPVHRTTPSVDKPGLPTSPISLRMPFFEKFKNQLPGVVAPSPTSPLPTNNSSNNTPSTAKQPAFPTRPRESTASSASSYSQGFASRSLSMSTTASRQIPQTDRRPPSPISDSGSEYGGLAYADSTDYEDDEPPAELKSVKGKTNPPPPLPLTSSILRSGSIASVNHVRFPSTSVRSDRSAPANAFGHKRDTSASSMSSVSSAGGESRKSNSAAIAHALGLSQAPPSAYGRLGGPGIGMGGRAGRSASGSSSSGSRSGYSRGGGGTSGSSMGVMEREVKTLLEDADAAIPVEDRRGGLTKSKSTGKQRTFGVGEGVGSGSESSIRAPLSANTGTGAKAHRSNTVQAVPAAEPRSPKLPTRARTSVVKSAEPAKERARKPKVCLKCDRKIENGRWVQVDNGGVLCEKCWKNMYLPKCRRCNLPIENQAVSSADGQLKGKYHRECFNCHTCHKPFPDKSFYVFDGKPLCAYHYHEENDSLCAAARCGQPIEGPCAVSHTGDRYHPEHMTCEYPGNPPCKQRLEEYWEVDGRMLCERHAHASKVGSDDEEGEEDWVQSSRALKRVTRFIDLAGRPPSEDGSGSGLR
ncbi:hypothetical protein D9615_001605 [Tricholomella constricta]|uniref:LIM zinc-binding domain-containing protein n=1 Tax=Tricholomella constricta TaxID=117010 RepID=A0A8H5M9Z6_9AGAR|nr:hypothetical protein D9615_001605 [Tricholomella constricta]